MNIFIKSIKVTDFKSIRSRFVLLNRMITNILGRNTSGKSTLLDAFLWALFSKNSSGETDFAIKPHDENGKAYHNLNTEVEVALLVDDQDINIRHAYREKWVTKRGSNTKIFDGHTHDFFWNDVPLKESVFKAKLASVIEENLFKLLTNVTYFNSLKWQDRRNVLLSIAGNISDEDVFDKINSNVNVEELKKAFLQKKTLKEFKDEIAAKRKKIKDELDLIPTRIEEANRSLPADYDYSLVEKNMIALKEEIIGIDQLLNNKSATVKQHQESILVLMKVKQNKSTELLNIESGAKNAMEEKSRDRMRVIQEQKIKLRAIGDDLTITRNHYSNIEKRIAQLTTEQNTVREEWHTINNSQLVFDDNEFCCPACKRAFEEADIETKKAELTANFNTDKSNKLAAKQSRGIELKEEIAKLNVELDNLKAKGLALAADEQKQAAYITQLEEQHNRLNADEVGELEKYLAEHQQYNILKKEIEHLTEQINAPAPEQNNQALLLNKQNLQKDVDEMIRQLAGKDQRIKIFARIEELKKQEEAMSQEYTSLDGIEYSIEQFNRAKMDTLEQRVNGRFSMVRFQMFEEQVNGGMADACITLVNSNGSYVPYSDANTAAKIQAGLDIIHTLSNHYGIKAPVWIDNRESVTDIPETGLQIINLIVSPEYDKLTVAEMEMEEATA